ncbi:unnamed protein product [Leptidea sinapis]|uniref:Peroxidase n=1 Tax=Leptidea sinapis TaxID=189913 RepID=A0A5E4Q8Z0_9NEOP|nr:unnamed protein product [Leptidea sinapis]
MFLLLFLFFLSVNALSNYHESYTGKRISEEEYKEHVKQNTSFWCTNEILPCHPLEGRRVDGSCNNLKYYTLGAVHTPQYRILPPEYSRDDRGFEPKLTKRGNDMPLPRAVRTNVLLEGHLSDRRFTQLLTHFLVHVPGDFLSLHDTVNYVQWKPYCCTEKGKQDNMCIPIKVPDEDPVHRFSGIRCFNLTRPESFQSARCRPNNTLPERIVTSTPALDLSNIYGNNMKLLNEKGRLFKGGLLKFEMVNGAVWPPSIKGPANLCYGNHPPMETRCHDTPESGANSVLGSNLFSIWTWRYHNVIANALAAINPCWDDERLFYTSREINIAVTYQIFLYEALALLMGQHNLINAGVLSPGLGFRDIYDDNLAPQVSMEFPFVLRWFHTLQEGILRLYDEKGYHLRDDRITNMTLRTGYLVDNLPYVTQGAFRQPSAKLDYAIDSDMAQTVLTHHQRASDVFTSDLTKNRYFFFPSYVKYREFCFHNKYRRFEDLVDAIDPERIELLREKYTDVEDIDLIVGLWLERPISGGYVPPTLYCISVVQLVRTIASDRHWYERPNRPNAFSFEQLLEIRKSTIASFMCTVGDSVTEIQPQAFLRAGPGNEIQSCDHIDRLNINAWYDHTCSRKPH